MNVNLTSTQILDGLAMLLVPMWMGRVSARRVTADTTRTGAGLLPLTERVLVGASVLAGVVQWIALTYPGAHGLVRVAVLGLPALFASYTLTVITVDTRRGGR